MKTPPIWKRGTKMSKQSVAQVRALLSSITDPQDPRLAEFKDDPRKGVQAALNQFAKRLEKGPRRGPPF